MQNKQLEKTLMRYEMIFEDLRTQIEDKTKELKKVREKNKLFKSKINSFQNCIKELRKEVH